MYGIPFIEIVLHFGNKADLSVKNQIENIKVYIFGDLKLVYIWYGYSHLNPYTTIFN